MMLLPLALAVAATPPAETGSEAAAAVVRAYYSAINAKDYRAAYRLWHGRYSYGQVVAGYAKTAHVTVTPVPPFDVEGAAGSSYCEVPVEVHAVLTDGRRQHFRGSFTLRRVNDVDGSTAAQRRWHIEAAKLGPA